MTHQAENDIPAPEKTDNIFLQIAFSEEMPEAEKARAIAALIEPGKNLETAPRENIMQQLEYAKGYISGATPRTPAEKETYVSKLRDENMLYMVALSGKTDERALKMFKPKLKDTGALPGSSELLAYEKRLREYQFLLGYLEGERTLKKELRNGFNTASAPDGRPDPTRAKPQLAPEVPPEERGPHARDLLKHLRMYFY